MPAKTKEQGIKGLVLVTAFLGYAGALGVPIPFHTVNIGQTYCPDGAPCLQIKSQISCSLLIF